MAFIWKIWDIHCAVYSLSIKREFYGKSQWTIYPLDVVWMRRFVWFKHSNIPIAMEKCAQLDGNRAAIRFVFSIYIACAGIRMFQFNISSVHINFAGFSGDSNIRQKLWSMSSNLRTSIVLYSLDAHLFTFNFIKTISFQFFVSFQIVPNPKEKTKYFANVN